MGNYLEIILNFLKTPQGLAVIIAIVVTFIKWLFENTGLGKYRTLWEKYGGIVVKAFDMTEKFIPDGTDNKALAKIDSFLKVFVESYTEAYSKTPPKKLLTWAKQQASMLAHEIKEKK